MQSLHCFAVALAAMTSGYRVLQMHPVQVPPSAQLALLVHCSAAKYSGLVGAGALGQRPSGYCPC